MIKYFICPDSIYLIYFKKQFLERFWEKRIFDISRNGILILVIYNISI
jgi:hypothetical protein